MSLLIFNDRASKYIHKLRNANSDGEKFSTLLEVLSMFESKDCDLEFKKLIFESVGEEFLSRLLKSKIGDNLPYVCKNAALDLLNALCSEDNLVYTNDILVHIPELFDIVMNTTSSDYCDEHLIILHKVYDCLQWMCFNDTGRDRLIKLGAIGKFVQIYCSHSFHSNKGLAVLVTLLHNMDRNVLKTLSLCEININSLIYELAVDFATDHTLRKVKLCNAIKVILTTYDKNALFTCSNISWQLTVHDGLIELLTYGSNTDHRIAALELSSIMVDMQGLSWIFPDIPTPEFLLVLVRITSEEVVKHLTQHDVKDPNTKILNPSFSILDYVVKFVTAFEGDFQSDEKHNLYTALKNAFSAILDAIKEYSFSDCMYDEPQRIFWCSLVKPLGSWIAAESISMKFKIYQMLPSILNIVNMGFIKFRTWYISKHFELPHAHGILTPRLRCFDLTTFIIPAIRNLSVDETAREIMLREKQDEMLLEYFNFYWSVATCGMKIPQSRSPQDFLLLPDDAQAVAASICRVFMNFILLENNISEKSTYVTLFNFIVEHLPTLEMTPARVMLYTHMAVLGLILLKQQSKSHVEKTIPLIKFVTSTFRFLDKALSVDASRPHILTVSDEFESSWGELLELWILGMQVFGCLFLLLPWLPQFVFGTSWPQHIVYNLANARPRCLPPHAAQVYEEFLCDLVKANPSTVPILIKKGANIACNKHNLDDLKNHLVIFLQKQTEE